MIQILGSDIDDEIYILDVTHLVHDCSITVVLACSSMLVTDHFRSCHYMIISTMRLDDASIF